MSVSGEGDFWVVELVEVVIVYKKRKKKKKREKGVETSIGRAWKRKKRD